MPELHAFRGLRYDLGHVGALSDVVAPPYDVIDPELQTALYRRHPANVIRLILNRSETGDADAGCTLCAGGSIPQELDSRGRADARPGSGDLCLPPGIHARPVGS